MLTAEKLDKLLAFKFKDDLSAAENITLFHLFNLSLRCSRVNKIELLSKNEVFSITVPKLIELGYIVETTETYLSLNKDKM